MDATIQVGGAAAASRSLLRMMLLIRLVEERIGELVSAGEIKTPCHLSIGQEAIAVGAFSQVQPDGPLPDGWTPLTFRRIDRHTRYTLVRDDERGRDGRFRCCFRDGVRCC